MSTAEETSFSACLLSQGNKAKSLDGFSYYCHKIIEHFKYYRNAHACLCSSGHERGMYPLTALHHLHITVDIPIGVGEGRTVGVVLREYRSALPQEWIDRGV